MHTQNKQWMAWQSTTKGNTAKKISTCKCKEETVCWSKYTAPLLWKKFAFQGTREYSMKKIRFNLATNYVFYAWNYQGFFLLFFFTHLGYSLNFTVVCHCQVKGGIPPPSRGIVGDNRSTRSKTTVRRKRVGPLGSNGAPLLGSHRVIFLLVFIYRKWMLSCSMIWE